MAQQITAEELSQRLKSAAAPRLLDVRQPEEHAFAALPGAKLIPLGELNERAGEIADWKDREIVVYCHHGIRSLHAIAHLTELGFGNLVNLSGGIDAWARSVDSTMPRY